MEEGGDFYMFKVYKKLPSFISPFCLSNSKYQKQFWNFNKFIIFIYF